MHNTSSASGEGFSKTYGGDNLTVVDIGGRSVCGSLRSFFESRNMKFICVDLEPHESVDLVVKPGEPLPLEDGSVDLVISTSCFEHDPCFWMTFREMCRITKLGGFIYVNAPSNGPYHGFPGDNWRFYRDASQALAYWSCKKIGNEPVYPCKVEEMFFIEPSGDVWRDFVTIWQRTEELTDSIVLSEEIISKQGKLRTYIEQAGFKITEFKR